MKNIFLVMMSVLLMGIASAEKIKPTLEKDSIQSKAFMTNLDRLGDSISNITIQNTSGAQTFTITGIFIQQLFQADCTTSYFNEHGKLYGVMWSNDITFIPSASTSLGAGYLYSMIMNYLYEASTTGGPAATTPGNGAGTWCIQLGILQGAPAQYPTYSVNTNTTPSPNLNNVVTWTNNTNPAPIAITCNDGSQQCTATAATQGFPVS
jgi:hypothetical protein